MLLINYDNYTVFEGAEIQVVVKSLVKAATDAACMQGVISDDMKLYAIDILMKRTDLATIRRN